MSRVFVDVRDPEEYQADHVKGAINIPPSDIISGAKKLKNVSKNTELILYCYSGVRSNTAIGILQSLGFTNIVNGINQEHVRAKYREVK